MENNKILQRSSQRISVKQDTKNALVHSSHQIHNKDIVAIMNNEKKRKALLDGALGIITKYNEDLFLAEDDGSGKHKIGNSPNGMPAIVISGPHQGRRGLLNNFGNIKLDPETFFFESEIKTDIPMRNIVTHYTTYKLPNFDPIDFKYVYNYKKGIKITDDPNVMLELEKDYLEELSDSLMIEERHYARVKSEYKKARIRVAVRLGEIINENDRTSFGSKGFLKLEEWRMKTVSGEQNPENSEATEDEIFRERQDFINSIRNIYPEYRCFHCRMGEQEEHEIEYW